MAWVWATWEIALVLIGLLGLGLGVIYAYLASGIKAKEHGGWVAAIGFVVVLIALGGAALVPAQVTPPTQQAGPNVSLSTFVQTAGLAGVAPALPSACTNYASSATVTCTIGFNKTQTGFQLALSNTTGLGYTAGAAGTSYAALNYLDVALHSSRTDQVNTSYLFTYTYATLPSWTSTGSTITTCSVVGFTTATSTAQGQWKAQFHAGQNGGIYPTESAPGVTTQVGADPTVVTGFGAVTQVAQISFAGGNSTATSYNCWAGLSLYQSLTVTISVGQSTPPLFTIDLLPIGYNT